MAVDERARHELHNRLGGVLGPDAAATLMTHLPPTGWGDVVTRDYLDSRLEQLDARIDRRFSAMEDRFAKLDSRFAAIDGRFAAMDSRFAAMEGKMDGRFAAIDGRFAAIDERFLRIEQLIEASKRELLAALREEIGFQVIGQTRAIIFAMITTVAAVCGLAVTLAMLT
jgi:hypothetical protein